ncbi:cytochrome P450 89A2 [Brachypodium distachyon]|nr:cytochrome P450 89A2 [Brachypodium distachyon]XP_024317611.1 cytochrome P450 89A2 [Brachypodium distachyon]|eukprot:XP_003571058.1 cytochrome P450 89A2 [Brachypodium distachyon]
MEAAGSPQLLLCVTLALTLAASLLFFLIGGRRRSNGRLPPGPPALLFLAKFLALGRSIFDLGPLLVDLHARHGPVISIRLFRTLVFVADRKAAHKALVQGGATFADRPPPLDPGRMLTAGGRDISSSSYGPYWRLVRRNLAAEALSPARVALFGPARKLACDGLVRSLLREQGDEGTAVMVRPLLRRAMFELLVYMCFGARLGQPELDEVESLQQEALRSVTTFPVFAFFPAVTKRLFRRRWATYLAVRRRQDELFVPLIHATKLREDDPPCYADSLLAVRVADEGGRALTDAEMVSLCSEFLNGGTDTTVTLLEWIVAELVNHPDVQSKLHDEVTKSSNPDLNDVQAMPPYLKAVVMEGLRLHPPGHFVLPHGVQSDGAEIGGYAVPRGSEVNFLVAEIGRDDAVWTAAREFRPERFMEGGEGHGVDVTGSREIKMMPFGAGRRVCPGYSLGMHHAEYFVARMVRELEFRRVGKEMVDMAEVLDFTTVMKHPLRARVVART